MDSPAREVLGHGAYLRQLTGLWWPKMRRAPLRTLVLASVQIILVALLPIFVSLKMYKDTHMSKEQFTAGSAVAFVSLGYLVKSLFFIMERATLHQLVELLSGLWAQNGISSNDEPIRFRYKRMSRYFYTYVQVAETTAAFFWIVNPLLSTGDTEHSSRQLPVPLWLPIDIQESPTYEVLYVIQALGVMSYIEGTIFLNYFFFHMMLMVAAELEILNCNLSCMQASQVATEKLKVDNSKYRSLTYLSNDHPSHTVKVSWKNDADGCLYDELVSNVQHHQKILRSISHLQAAMNVSIYFLFFTNTLTVCSSVFIGVEMYQKDGDLTKALHGVLSLPPLLSDLAMFCVLGNNITDQGERLVNSAFICDWLDCDVRFRRTLFTLMTVAAKPPEIMVGKTCKLSKEVLLQILNLIYALLNVLYQFQST